MATVVNRTTLECRHSVNTPDYSVEDWVINPDLTGFHDVPSKYWKISGDDITEMTQAEKDAVDAAEPTPDPTEEERITDLEDRVTAIEDA